MPIISDVANVKIRGENSLQIYVPEGDYSAWDIRHQYDTPQNWGSYDFLCFWWYGNSTGATLNVGLYDNLGNSWHYMLTEDWVGWRRVIIPLRKPSQTYGTLNLNQIKLIQISHRFGANPTTVYIDRGGLDLGNWVKIEVQTPDFLRADGWATILRSYNPSLEDWDEWFLRWDAETPNHGDQWNIKLVFLDGTNAADINPSAEQNMADYGKGGRGETKNPLMGNAGSLTYSQTYGCQYRIGFAIKMPPWTGSDNLTGKFAINKAKLKLEVYHADEKTSYVDGSTQT